jgi:hypothetical protein
MPDTYYPGTRVKVFDGKLYCDDHSTPPSVTLQPATILRWYGCRASKTIGGYPYPSLIDVRFDHDGRESKGHFAEPLYAEVIEAAP